MAGGWVYIMTNHPNGTLYVGVSANLAQRYAQHREGAGSAFVHRYGLTRLVYAERHEDIIAAIQREKNLKHWPRAWKTLVAQNPEWRELGEGPL